YVQRVMQVDPVMIDGTLDRLPPLRFNRPPRSRAAIIVRRHLGEDAVAQSQRRVAKTGEVAALQQFGIHNCAGADNFSAARTDSGDLPPLLQRHARDLSGNTAYHFAGSVSRRPALPGT